jgi:oligogalacturonide transporter
MAIDIAMALAVFYLSVSLQKDDLFEMAMGAILVVQLIFIIVFSRVAQKFGKKVPGFIAAGVWILANVFIFSFTPQTPDALVVAVCAFIGVGAAGCNLVSWSILPDISDVDELMTGKRREGLYSGVSTFLRKLSGGLVVGATGIMLDIFHYNDEAVSAGNIEPLTTVGIKLLFCAVPVIFLILMLIFLKKYRLGKHEFAVMHGVLSTYRQEGAPVKLSSEQVSVCQKITGVDAKELVVAVE